METNADPLKVGQILKDSIKTCYGHPGQFLLPSVLVGLFTIAGAMLNALASPVKATPGVVDIKWPFVLAALALSVVGFVLYIYFVAAVPVMTAYLRAGRRLAWTEAFGWVRKRRIFWGTVLTLLIFGFIIGIGLLLFIVPGLIFGAWYILVVPAKVLGDVPAEGTLTRSKELVKPVFRSALGLFSLTWLVYLVPALGGLVLTLFLPSSSPWLVGFPIACVSVVIFVFWLPVTLIAFSNVFIDRSGGVAMLRGDLMVEDYVRPAKEKIGSIDSI